MFWQLDLLDSLPAPAPAGKLQLGAGAEGAEGQGKVASSTLQALLSKAGVGVGQNTRFEVGNTVITVGEDGKMTVQSTQPGGPS